MELISGGSRGGARGGGRGGGASGEKRKKDRKEKSKQGKYIKIGTLTYHKHMTCWIRHLKEL